MSYVLSANVNRRNLTKGQRAMAASLMNSFPRKESWGEKSRVAIDVGVSASGVSKALLVIEHAPELADAVMAGTVPLNDAYAEAKQRKEAKESREEKTRRDEVLIGC